MRWTHLVALVALPFALVVAGCAADTTEDPSVSPEDPAASEDDHVDQTTEDLTAKPTFATVGPIVSANCGGCHAQFGTLDGIKADKTAMIAKITSGAMPKGNPTWKKTADGKKALKWLKTGADLK